MLKEVDVLTRIKEKMPTMSKGQRRIGTYLMENCEKVAYLTAAKLGETVGVSESTVVRFAVELEYDGYPGLQQAIEELLNTTLTTVQRIELTSNRIADKPGMSILRSVLTEDTYRIKTTLAEINEQDFESSINALLSADRIYIIGGRSAAALAEFFGFYLTLALQKVKIISSASTGEMFEEIHSIGRGDVMVAISFPRYSKKTLKAAEYAFSQGARVIVLTDRMQSPLVQHSHYKLIAKSDMVSFVDSLVAPMSIINALLVAISIRTKDELSKTLQKLERIWNEYDVYDKG